jgi:hypothetical protein
MENQVTIMEENQMQNQSSNGSWNDTEKKILATFIAPIYEMQKTYSPKNLKMIMRGWEMKLAGRYPVEDIMKAVDKYTNTNADFPTPSDVIEAINKLSMEDRKLEKWQIELAKAIGYEKIRIFKDCTFDGKIMVFPDLSSRQCVKDNYDGKLASLFGNIEYEISQKLKDKIALSRKLELEQIEDFNKRFCSAK